jgi:hypothetical protein
MVRVVAGVRVQADHALTPATFLRGSMAKKLQRDSEIETDLGLPEGFLRSRRNTPDSPPFYDCGPRSKLYSPDEVREWLRSRARHSDQLDAAHA